MMDGVEVEWRGSGRHIRKVDIVAKASASEPLET